jgi:hypothetical protein
MPLFSLDIEKELLGEYWTNRYIISAADLAAATTYAAFYYDRERLVHSSNVLFTKYRVSDMNPLTDVYQIVQPNANGSRAFTTQEYMPLFCVVRVDFTAVGGGRPSRKYLRLPIYETDQMNGVLNTTYVSFIETNYSNQLVLDTSFVDVDGQDLNSGQVWPKVGMRQLRRGSKRKLQPIIV